jgi:2-oxoglutarate dehydrogenase E2 component (dihydrolipoamide succinyltransferase)
MPANIVVPELGESIVDARVARWLKQEGDRVAAGDPLVELETDKVDLEVGAPQGGVLKKIERQDGADVKIGEVLGVIEDAGAGAEAPSGRAGGARSETRGREDGRTGGREDEKAKTRATPTARRVAAAHEIDLEEVRGSGPGGRVTRGDVQAFVKRRPDAEAPAAPRPEPTPALGAERPAPVEFHGGIERREERVRMSKRRSTIARRLVEAQQTAAMLTTFNEADMSGVMAVRERHKKAFKERYGVSLGIASFFVKASIAALREFPRLNAEIQGDEMVLKHYYDIGIAVGAAEGLVVPVLRDADRLPFSGIERGIREFATKAAEGTLTLADLRGGTFTITNGGVFGSLLSTPILNPPQVGILGLHVIQDRAVPVGGQIAVRPMMYLALTYDHRIVDGAEAVRFLVRVKELVEDPAALILED